MEEKKKMPVIRFLAEHMDVETYCKHCRTYQHVKMINGKPTIVCNNCRKTFVINDDLTVEEGVQI